MEMPSIQSFHDVKAKWVAENTLAFAIYDGYPVSPGHVLIIPKRVCPTWFDATGQSVSP